VRLETGSGSPLRKPYVIFFILGLAAAVVAGLVYLLGPCSAAGGVSEWNRGPGEYQPSKNLILSFGFWAPSFPLS